MSHPPTNHQSWPPPYYQQQLDYQQQHPDPYLPYAFPPAASSPGFSSPAVFAPVTSAPAMWDGPAVSGP
ncbi:hypothetical protein, partial [Winogradskya consettensis]|uniref:hypothetical protein n=1 Tax=Winogradskya consettensis TaxID=113560 RepID=UPI001BB36186